MCPCPDFNCALCLGLASPMDGTDKMEVEFGDEKKQRENTHQEASIEVMQRVTDETLIVETAVWPIPFLINVFTALKGSQF